MPAYGHNLFIFKVEAAAQKHYNRLLAVSEGKIGVVYLVFVILLILSHLVTARALHFAVDIGFADIMQQRCNSYGRHRHTRFKVGP